LKGTIQKYFSNRGFGFIEIDGKEDNIFFHRSNFPVNEIPSIGQDVEFTIVETPKGNEAKEIKLVASAPEASEEPEEVATLEEEPEEVATLEEEPEEVATPEEVPEEAPASVDNLDQMQGIGPKYQELLNITKRPPTLAKVEDWVEKAKNPE